MAESKLKPQAVDAQLIPAAAQTTTAKARAYLSAAQSIPNNPPTVINLDVEQYDPGNNYNTGTFRFTAPVTGWYYVMGSLQFSTSGQPTNFNVGLARNGAVQTLFDQFANRSDGGEIGGSGSDILFASAGDYFQIVTEQSSGAARPLFSGPGRTVMTVHLISI